MTTTTTAPTAAQVITWLATQTHSNFAASLTNYYRRNGRLSPAQEAAALNMYMRANPADQNEPEVRQGNLEVAAMIAAEIAAVTVGFYLQNGNVYKVRRAQAGHLYAMVRTVDGWDMARGMMRVLKATDKIDAQQAVKFGLTTGICIFCNAELDDEDGLGKRCGVGPVCSRKYLDMTQRQLIAALGL
jgi:hypothetical protein